MKREPVTAGSNSEERDHKIRLETRAREFTLVASLREVISPKA
jgi:hypothetical protein